MNKEKNNLHNAFSNIKTLRGIYYFINSFFLSFLAIINHTLPPTGIAVIIPVFILVVFLSYKLFIIIDYFIFFKKYFNNKLAYEKKLISAYIISCMSVIAVQLAGHFLNISELYIIARLLKFLVFNIYLGYVLWKALKIKDKRLIFIFVFYLIYSFLICGVI